MGEYNMKDNIKDNDMKEVLTIYFHIKTKLENAPSLCQFFYHGWMHTKSCYDAVCYLAASEDITDENVRLLKIASLYHDTGYILGDEEYHEYKSAVIAREELHSFGFSEYEIDVICRLIISTILNKNSIDVLEDIMRDADLEYIGRDYYPYVAELLRRERSILHSVWKREQLTFLERHKFATSSAQKFFNHQKDINIRRLKADM
jgi:HD superfamily phosphodiesterase